MKSTSGWKDGGNGTNESGFNGFPGGYRYKLGKFYNIGDNGYWWSSSENVTNFAWRRGLLYYNGNVYRNDNGMSYGYSVRCIKD